MKTFPLLPLLSFSILASTPIQAQITLTTADLLNMYAVGKGQTQISAVDTTTYTMNVGAASALQTQSWSMPIAQYPDTSFYTNVTPSSTPYASTFPLATHVQTYSQVNVSSSITGYIYFRIANDSLLFIGSAFTIHFMGVDTTEFNSIPHFVLKTPLSLGSALTSYDSSYFAPGEYMITNSTMTFDAYGTITLPNGSFQCLRERRVDISESHSGTLVTEDTSIVFNWFTKEGHLAQAAVARNSQTSGTTSVVGPYYVELVNVPVRVHETPTTAPKTFALFQNYPNPFNPSTTIRYGIPTRSSVRIVITNALGQEVALLTNGEQEAGYHEVQWHANLASGIYFYRVDAVSTSDAHDQFMQVKKMMLLK